MEYIDTLKDALELCAESKCVECSLKNDPECMSDLATRSSEYIKELEECVDALREEMKSSNKRDAPMLPRNICGHCPNCGSWIAAKYHPKFCGHCGQAVKWG